MKRILLTSFAFVAISGAQAQEVTDTVSLGTGYANQVWYSLENDNQAERPKAEWDIAFDVSSFGTSVHANTANGTKVFTYPEGDASDWATVDISNIANWTEQYNSEVSWASGAFDQHLTADPFDVGWGIYNLSTHIVTGDSIFIVQLPSGDYKKLLIENMASGAYNFRYADVDGQNEVVDAITKADFSGKNFAYYSLETEGELDREPASADWDLVFTQYTSFVPTAYTVAGVLSNNGVSVAQAEGVDQATYEDFSSETFSTDINIIGYDWKTFSGSWTLETDWVYFVSTAAGDMWKVVFTGFGGTGTGNFIFSKEKLSAVGVIENEANNFSFVTYPNPTVNGNTTVVYTMKNNAQEGTLFIYSLSGELVKTEQLATTAGIHTLPVTTNELNSGVYIIQLSVDGAATQQRLVVQ